MLKKVVLYGIGIYILGLIFSGVTYAIMDFVPYFIAGMIITTPIYGAVRKQTGKGDNVKKAISFLIKTLEKIVKINKRSITAYLIVLIVVINTYQFVGEALINTLKVGGITFVAMFVLWECTRFAMNKFKNVQFLSYGEAVKGAF